MKRNATISLVLGVTISGLALYLAFRNVPFPELAAYLASVDYFWILPTLLAISAVFVLRTFRWQVILESAGSVTFWRAFHPLMIGFMINCILPGRVGEVARPAVLQKKENVPFSTGLATVAAERVFDVTVLIILFAVLLSTVRIDPDLEVVFGGYHLNRQALITAGVHVLWMLLLLLLGIFLVAFAKTRKLMHGVVMKIPSVFFFAGPEFKDKVQRNICLPLVYFIENFAVGFALVKRPKKIYACVGLSFAIWVVSGLSYYIMALGCPGITLSLPEIFAYMIIICFFIALPSVPGFWGIWEAGGVFGLTLFGVSTKDAAGFTLVSHAVQIFPVIFAGLVSAMLTGINILQVSYEQKRPDSSMPGS